MIVGIGTDMIEVRRVVRACRKDSFLRRCFTEAERELICGAPYKAADQFAVKEAVAKMLGVGFRQFMPSDIEALRDELGCPYVRLHGRAQGLCEEKGIDKVHVSITNTKEYAVAFVVGEGFGERGDKGGL